MENQFSYGVTAMNANQDQDSSGSLSGNLTLETGE
jgi:hypothetical protein